MSYKITWFCNATQKVTDKIFTDFYEAVEWGKKTLENFNTDLIQTIWN